MKKIVALAFGICLMGGAVSAQTLTPNTDWIV